MKQQKLTHATSTRIARNVIACRNRSNPQFFDINAQIEGWLAEIGLGWKLLPNTYIDGLSCQFIKDLARDIRLNAVKHGETT